MHWSYWLPGWATDGFIFQGVIRHLESRFKQGATLLDPPGFGSAPLSRGEKSYSARLIKALTGKRNPDERIYLVGWSMGALLALETACRLRGEISGLVLISACACFTRRDDNPWGKDKRILQVMKRRLKENTQSVLEDFFRGMFAPDNPERAERFLRQFWPRYREQAPEPLIQGLDYLSNFDLRRDLAELSLPVLLIHGELDAVVDIRLGRELAELLPKARLAEKARGDHIPFWENEEYAAWLISDFFAETSH